MNSPPTLRESRLDLLVTRKIDFHARQIKNAADAVDPQDYVTLKQLTNVVNSIPKSTETVVAASTPGPPGPPGPSGGNGNYVQVSGNLTPDLSNGSGSTFETTLNAATVNIVNPVNTVTNYKFTIVLKQDSTGNRTIAWGTNYRGVANQVWQDVNTGVYWSGNFVVRPDGKSMLIGLPYAGEAY